METSEAKKVMKSRADAHLRVEAMAAQQHRDEDEDEAHVTLIGPRTVATLPLPPSEGPADMRTAWKEGALNIAHSMAAFCMFVTVPAMIACKEVGTEEDASTLTTMVNAASDPAKAAAELGIKADEATIVAALAPWGVRLLFCIKDRPITEVGGDAAERTIKLGFPIELRTFWETYLTRFLSGPDPVPAADPIEVDASTLPGAPPSPLVTGEKGS